MLQQTTVAAVKSYFETFIQRWPTVHDLSAAEDAAVMAEWAGLGYYARARNLLKCARLVAHDHGGIFPDTEAELQKLPGIGPYTAAAIAAIAFDQPATVVDGNVDRVMTRLFALTTPLPEVKPTIRQKAASLTPDQRPGDYAQALMDLGATICTPRNPACGICPVNQHCAARDQGIADSLPRKAAKKPKPTRRGIAYFVQRSDGAILVETRPDSGLLGGMEGLPGSAWEDVLPKPAPPLPADWTIDAKAVRHSFTHFDLILDVHSARVENNVNAGAGRFVARKDFTLSDYPTVMRKAMRHGLSRFASGE